MTAQTNAQPVVDAHAALRHRVEQSRDRPWFEALDGRSFTFGAYWANAVLLSHSWSEQGLKPGDVVALKLPNEISFPCCYLACAIGGFVALPIADTQHPSLVSYMLEQVSPAIVLLEPPRLDETLELSGDCAAFSFARDQDAPFLIMFTAGSTGNPKAMCHSVRNVVGSAISFGQQSGMGPTTRLYHVLPMAYMAGFLNTMLAPFMAGGTVVEGPLFSPETAVDFWTRPLNAQVDTLSIIPSIAVALCRLTRNKSTIERIRSQIRQVQCTSAPLQKPLRKLFLELFDLPLRDCYGITELGGALTLQSDQDARTGYSSTPIPDIDLEIRATDEGDELWIRSPFTMLGYLRGDSLSRPLDERGFMATGDLASLQDGKLLITGRKKDIIIRGGVNVSPLRIEEQLARVEGVEDAAVVGVEHPFWGEQIVACVVCRIEDDPHLIPRLREHCAAHLGPGERPDRILRFETLPRSFVGKILRGALRERVGQILQTL